MPVLNSLALKGARPETPFWTRPRVSLAAAFQRPWVIALLLTALYFVGGKIGLGLAFVNVSASAVWPPTGIAIGALIVLGWRYWPAILVGAFLVNVTTTGTVETSLSIAVGNTLEGLVGAMLVNRFAGGQHAIDRLADILKFAVLAGGVATAISAFWGVTTLVIGGLAPASAYWTTWTTWWVGDAGGALIVAPLVLIWAGQMWGRTSWARLLELAVTGIVLIVVGGTIFGGLFAIAPNHYPLTFLSVPVLVWTAFRLGPRATATAMAALTAIAVIGTRSGYGPFARDSASESLFFLEGFLMTIALVGFGLSAAVQQRARAEAGLRDALDEVERRVRDRTADLAETSEALRRRKHQLSEAQAIAHIGSWEWDVGANLISWSDELYRLYGRTAGADPLVFEDFITAVHPDDRSFVSERVAASFTSHEPFELQHRLVRPDGAIRWMHGRGEVILDAQGHVVRMLGTGQDITDSRLAEDERAAAANRLAAVGAELQRSNRDLQDFATVASHDLQEPLRKIQAFGDRLATGHTDQLDESGRDDLVRIMAASARMQMLINDLLSYSRVASEPHSPVPVALNDVVTEVLIDLEQRRLETGGRVQAGPLPTVDADPTQLRQLMQNLIGNALKYRRADVAPEVDISCVGSPDSWKIEVADNGIGFAPEHAERIFAPFQRLHGRSEYEGTGMGLAICRRIAERHGGVITAEGRPDHGARFVVTFPRVKSQAAGQ